MLTFINKYFSNAFPPLIRYLHYLIIFLVLYQIVISNFIDVNGEGIINHNTISYYATWSHIAIGLVLFCLAITFVIIELSKHGFAYFYPYLFGDISQLKSDINQFKLLKLPVSAPGGVAAIVQGLGLGALLLVVISGLTWFLLWLNGSSLANNVKEIHELLTGLIEVYIIGHGGMGLIHIFMAYKQQKSTNESL